MAALPIHELADRLWNARLQRTPCAPLSETEPSITIADAYRISQLNFHRRTRIAGNIPIGRKIGLTSRAVQKQLGVDQPDYGYLTVDMQLQNGGQVPTGGLIQGRV